MSSRKLVRPLASRQVAMIVAIAITAMLPILAYGLWRSAMLQQQLWSPTLAHQALWILAFATVATPVAVYAAPPELRGWPAIAMVAVVGCAAANGVGPSLAACLVVLCCAITGQILFLIAGTGAQTPGPALCASTGLAVILLLLVAASLAHIPLALVAFLLPSATLAAPALSPRLRSALQRAANHTLNRSQTHHEPWPPLRTAIATLILATLLFYGANAALPERFYDPLVMHFMIPTQALTFGHWSPDPYSFAYGYFPMAADDLFGLALALGGENTVKLLNLLALAGILLLLHDIVRPMAGPGIAEATLLLLLAIPIALLLSTTAMVENLLTLQLLAAANAVMLLRAAPTSGLFALAVLLPSLAATKLHGAAAAIPCAALAWSAAARLPVSGRRTLSMVAIAAGILGAAQYADAWIRTGNPVYPFMNDLFRSPYWPPTAFADLRWMGRLSWRLPYRMTFDSRSYLESDNGAIGVGLFLLIIPGAIATILVPRRAPVIALVIAGFTSLVIVPQIQYIRYLWPTFPLLLIVCAHGLATLSALPGGRSLGVATTALAAALGLYLLPSAAWTLKAADLRAGFDPTARQTMLANQAATRFAVEAVNAVDPSKPRVLLGGEPYGAFLRGTPIYTAWYNRPLNAALHAAPDPTAVAALLDLQRANYVIANPASADPIEQKVTVYAAAHGTRIPLPGYAALWRINRPPP